MRRIVAGKPLARAFDRAAVWCRGESGLRKCAERQYRQSHFHLVSFAGDITRCQFKKTGRVHEVTDQSTPMPMAQRPARGPLAQANKCACPVRPSDADVAVASLFLFAGTEGWLPSRGLLARRRSNCLDLLFFGFLGLPIALLLAFGHADLPKVDDNAVMECEI
jgi:hypothetical protein